MARGDEIADIFLDDIAVTLQGIKSSSRDNGGPPDTSALDSTAAGKILRSARSQG